MQGTWDPKVRNQCWSHYTNESWQFPITYKELKLSLLYFLSLSQLQDTYHHDISAHNLAYMILYLIDKNVRKTCKQILSYFLLIKKKLTLLTNVKLKVECRPNFWGLLRISELYIDLFLPKQPQCNDKLGVRL